MAISGFFRALTLMVFATGGINAQSNTCDSSPQSRGADCLRRQGKGYASAYCSSILSIAVPTATTTATLEGTGTFTTTKTVITDTLTTYVDTKTTTSTSLLVSYTCGKGNATITASVPSTGTGRNSTTSTHTSRPSVGTITNSAGPPTGSISGTGGSITPSSNLSVTAIWPSYTTSYSAIPSYGAIKEKRQSEIFYTPRCFREYARTKGATGITNACKCLAVTTSSPNSTTTSFVWAASTTTTLTESTAEIVKATSTTTKFSSSTITMASSTPTSFNIYYTDPRSNTTDPPSNFFKAITAPGGSGIVLAGEAAADSFTLDSHRRLVDTTDGDAFIAKNEEDLYPFELLQTTALTKDTPICSACNNTLQCDYPGTTGNTFALCYGYLALGPPNVFGKDSNGDGHIDCVPIKLQFK